MLAIKFRNIETDEQDIADYEVEVLVSDPTFSNIRRMKLIWEGYVERHPRKDGWLALLERFVREHKIREER